MSKRAERSTDPRVQRTRHTLHKAILDLASERPLESLSVADIAERAQVNRATFYSHYDSLDELLDVALQFELEGLLEAAAQLELPALGEGKPATPPEIVAFFRTIDRRAVVYRHVFGPNGSAKVVHGLRQRVAETIARKIPSARSTDGIPRAVHAHALAGSLIALLTYWLSAKPKPSAERIAEWTWISAMDTLRRATR